MDGIERYFELMRKEGNRLKTFQTTPPWPKDYVDIKKLAKAGFFYGFSGDNVFCAFCRGQVCKWDRDDDPMSEHARHFSTCPFIMGGEVGNVPLGDDPFPGPKRPRPYDVCGTYINQPLESRLRSNGSLGGSPLSGSSPRSGSPPSTGGSPPSSSPSLRLSLDETNHNSSILYHPHSLPSDSNNEVDPQCTSSSTSESSNGICKICYSNAIELVFLPCGHSVSCIACSRRLASCPYCRLAITCRLRTYIV